MKKFLLRKKIISILIILIFLASVMYTVSYALFGEVIDGFLGISSEESQRFKEVPELSNAEVAKKRAEEYEKELKLKAENVVINEATSNKLKSQKGGSKLYTNYKRMIAEKDLNENQQNRLDQYVLENIDIVDMLSLYEYLYDSFFTYEDMDVAIERCNSGEALENVLETYMNIEASFEPIKLETKEWNRLIEDCQLQVEAVALGEVISQRGFATFDEIIADIINYDNWEIISDKYGIMNVSGKMDVITITDEELDKCAKELRISTAEAKIKVVEAKKHKVKSEDLVKYIKSNKRASIALKEYYTSKYLK